MQSLTPNMTDGLTYLQDRIELICTAFETGLPSCFNLEGYLDAIEREERGAIWW